MMYKKAGLALFFTLTTLFIVTPSAEAQSTTENVSVFYKNEEGKNLVLQKANDVDANLNNIDAVVGTFSKSDIEVLEASNDIVVVHTSNKKLQFANTATVALPFANFKTTWTQNMVQAPIAWNKGLDGKNIKVGIIDAEVAKHSFLPSVHRKNFATLPNPESNAAKHGTLVAGVIAAQPLTNGSMFGISPAVDLYSMNVDGEGGGDLNDIIRAIDYAIAEKLQIVNISMGISINDLLDPGEKINESPLVLAVKKAQKAGILFVAASGNNGNGVDYPAAISDVVAVGSVTSTKNISSFSNRGEEIDIVGPGSAITSLNYAGGFSSGNNGTSFATPHVTGVLAILKQQFPNETNQELVTRLEKSAEDLGTVGVDATYGHGLAKYTEQKDKPVVETEVKVPVVVETAAEKYARLNRSKIATTTTKMASNKKVNYLTEFTPLYSIYNELTSKQKVALVNYRKAIGAAYIASNAKSSRISATNIATIKTKKTSTLSFSSKFKVSSISSSAFAMYKDGSKYTKFSVTRSKTGKAVTIRPTSTLAKGTYYLSIDTTKFRTTANKIVKPYMVKYVVK